MCLCIGLTVNIQVNVLCILAVSAVELLAVLVGVMGRCHFIPSLCSLVVVFDVLAF